MKSDIIYRDGDFVEADHASQGPFVHRFIRTAGHKPIFLGAHLDLLAQAAEAIFGLVRTIDERECSQAIASLLRRNACAEHFSHVVMVRIYADGILEILFHETSLYDRMSMRMIQPKAISLLSHDTTFTYPSSATIATTTLHRAYAAGRGADVVVAISKAGEVLSIDGAPAAIIRNRAVTFSTQAFAEPEYEAIIEAATAQKRTIECRIIHAEELLQADEIFYIDHRGVTGLAQYDSRQYLTFSTESIARAIKHR